MPYFLLYIKDNVKSYVVLEQKGTKYIRENVCLTLPSSAVFCLQSRVSDFF